MSQLYRVKAYLNHWLNVVDVHSVHSPFFYDFYSKVVKGVSENPYFESIEKMRENLLENQSEIQVDDLGAGSINGYGSKRKLSEITKTSLSPSPMVKLFYRICQYTGAKKIVELGTSVGLTSLYLSHLANARIYTFEGSHSLVNVALTNFEYFERRNIRLVEGDIGSTLPEFLQSDTAKIGFAFLDANHRYAPTLQYFQWLMKRFSEKSVMVIDDIHHSEEMEKAWKELKKHDLVYGSIDLFRCGVLFFEPALNKQHFVWTL